MTVEFLRNIRGQIIRLSQLQQRKKELFSAVLKITATQKDVNVQKSVGNSTEQKYINYFALEEEIDSAINSIFLNMRIAQKEISTLSDSAYQTVLEKYYLELKEEKYNGTTYYRSKTIEEVAKEVGYSVSHTKRIKAQALEELFG